MFVLYAVSNIMGVTDIKDEKFITRNKNYLTITEDEIKVNISYRWDRCWWLFKIWKTRLYRLYNATVIHKYN